MMLSTGFAPSVMVTSTCALLLRVASNTVTVMSDVVFNARYDDVMLILSIVILVNAAGDRIIAQFALKTGFNCTQDHRKDRPACNPLKRSTS